MAKKEMYSRLDRIALNTWPAEITVVCGSWILRASSGVTKRANSVWTSDGSGPWDPNDGRMERIDAFYKSHGLPVRFHISDASPDGLAAWLERQGYFIEAPCLVMAADALKVAELTSSGRNDGFHSNIAHRHDEAWLRSFIELEGHRPELTGFYDKLFGRIRHTAAYVRIMHKETCVAVGTAVAESSMAGFTNVVVHPDWRGQGIGKRLIHALAEWCLQEDAGILYLQVIADNEPAVRLYRGAGYDTLFTYHYRTCPGA